MRHFLPALAVILAWAAAAAIPTSAMAQGQKSAELWRLVDGKPSGFGLGIEGGEIRNGARIIMTTKLSERKEFIVLTNGAVVLAENPKFGLTVLGQNVKDGAPLILHEGYNRWDFYGSEPERIGSLRLWNEKTNDIFFDGAVYLLSSDDSFDEGSRVSLSRRDSGGVYRRPSLWVWVSTPPDDYAYSVPIIVPVETRNIPQSFVSSGEKLIVQCELKSGSKILQGTGVANIDTGNLETQKQDVTVRIPRPSKMDWNVMDAQNFNQFRCGIHNRTAYMLEELKTKYPDFGRKFGVSLDGSLQSIGIKHGGIPGMGAGDFATLPKMHWVRQDPHSGKRGFHGLDMKRGADGRGGIEILGDKKYVRIRTRLFFSDEMMSIRMTAAVQCRAGGVGEGHVFIAEADELTRSGKKDVVLGLGFPIDYDLNSDLEISCLPMKKGANDKIVDVFDGKGGFQTVTGSKRTLNLIDALLDNTEIEMPNLSAVYWDYNDEVSSRTDEWNTGAQPPGPTPPPPVVPEKPKLNPAEGDYFVKVGRLPIAFDGKCAPYCNYYLSSKRDLATKSKIFLAKSNPVIFRLEHVKDNVYKLKSQMGCPSDSMCGAELSFDTVNNKRGDVTIEMNDPGFWEISPVGDTGRYTLKSVWNCETKGYPLCKALLGMDPSTRRATITPALGIEWLLVPR